MNVRIFWVRAMKCMYAQTRPRFMLSSEGVFGGMEFEPMLTPREKSPLPKMSPEEDRTRDAVDSEPKHYQLSYSAPRFHLTRCMYPNLRSMFIKSYRSWNAVLWIQDACVQRFFIKATKMHPTSSIEERKTWTINTLLLLLLLRSPAISRLYLWDSQFWARFSTMMECDYLNDRVKKLSHTQKSHPKWWTPEKKLGNAEEEEVYWLLTSFFLL